MTINEAVELAKKYSTENSSRFINGVLGSAVRDLGEEKSRGKVPEGGENE